MIWMVLVKNLFPMQDIKFKKVIKYVQFFVYHLYLNKDIF